MHGVKIHSGLLFCKSELSDPWRRRYLLTPHFSSVRFRCFLRTKVAYFWIHLVAVEVCNVYIHIRRRSQVQKSYVLYRRSLLMNLYKHDLARAQSCSTFRSWISWIRCLFRTLGKVSRDSSQVNWIHCVVILIPVILISGEIWLTSFQRFSVFFKRRPNLASFSLPAINYIISVA